MAFEINRQYHDVFAELQKTYVTLDPFGEKITFWQGQQFKFLGTETIGGCTSCGTTLLKVYVVDAYAHCEPDDFIWQQNNTGLSIQLPEELIVETRNLKLPPIKNDYVDETSGKDTDLFTPPHLRKIPREGGLWYDDPWHSNRTK